MVTDTDRLNEAEQAAVAILGGSRVLTQALANGEVELPIRYSDETLRACADENREGSADWRLVYLRGHSLREEQKRVGVSQEHQPCFCNTNWWVGGLIGRWLRTVPEKFEPGYYLIEFNGRFGQTTWRRQEEAIRALGPRFQRAHEAMVTEANTLAVEGSTTSIVSPVASSHWPPNTPELTPESPRAEKI